MIGRGRRWLQLLRLASPGMRGLLYQSVFCVLCFSQTPHACLGQLTTKIGPRAASPYASLSAPWG